MRTAQVVASITIHTIKQMLEWLTTHINQTPLPTLIIHRHNFHDHHSIQSNYWLCSQTSVMTVTNTPTNLLTICTKHSFSQRISNSPVVPPAADLTAVRWSVFGLTVTTLEALVVVAMTRPPGVVMLRTLLPVAAAGQKCGFQYFLHRQMTPSLFFLKPPVHATSFFFQSF